MGKKSRKQKARLLQKQNYLIQTLQKSQQTITELQDELKGFTVHRTLTFNDNNDLEVKEVAVLKLMLTEEETCVLKEEKAFLKCIKRDIASTLADFLLKHNHIKFALEAHILYPETLGICAELGLSNKTTKLLDSRYKIDELSHENILKFLKEEIGDNLR